MGFEDVDRFDGILEASFAVGDFDSLAGVDDQIGPKLGIAADDLRRHASPGRVDDAFPTQTVRRQHEMLVDVVDGFLAGHSVTGNDGGRVDLLFDEVFGVAKQFGGDDDDGSGAVSDLLVLKLGQFDEHFGGRMLHVEKAQDRGPVVGHRHIANLGV